jgi:hypothetical protein
VSIGTDAGSALEQVEPQCVSSDRGVALVRGVLRRQLDTLAEGRDL